MLKVSHIPFEILDGSSEGGGTLVYEDALKRTGKSQVLKNIKIIIPPATKLLYPPQRS